MSFRKILVGVFMVGILCCGIGAGVMFQEYSSFKYMGERRIGSNKIEEKTLTENLYTDKTKKLNTSFITYNNYNNEEDNIKLKTSKAVPKDKVQIKVRYDSDNVKDVHIDKNLYSNDEYIGDVYTDEGEYGENSTDDITFMQEGVSQENKKSPTSQEFFISAVGRMSGIEYLLSYKDEILKNIKERKIYNYVYPQIISVEVTVNPENKNLIH